MPTLPSSSTFRRIEIFFVRLDSARYTPGQIERKKCSLSTTLPAFWTRRNRVSIAFGGKSMRRPSRFKTLGDSVNSNAPNLRANFVPGEGVASNLNFLFEYVTVARPAFLAPCFAEFPYFLDLGCPSTHQQWEQSGVTPLSVTTANKVRLFNRAAARKARGPIFFRTR